MRGGAQQGSATSIGSLLSRLCQARPGASVGQVCLHLNASWRWARTSCTALRTPPSDKKSLETASPDCANEDTPIMSEAPKCLQDASKRAPRCPVNAKFQVASKSLSDFLSTSSLHPSPLRHCRCRSPSPNPPSLSIPKCGLHGSVTPSLEAPAQLRQCHAV